jgi:hypothetical protein
MPGAYIAAIKERLIADEESLVIKIKNTPLDEDAVIAVRYMRSSRPK